MSRNNSDNGNPESRENACTPHVRCDGLAVDDQHETLRPSVGRADAARHDDLPDGFVELLLRLTARCAFHFGNHVEAFLLVNCHDVPVTELHWYPVRLAPSRPVAADRYAQLLEARACFLTFREHPPLTILSLGSGAFAPCATLLGGIKVNEHLPSFVG
jgi:hypothetical protein